MTSGSPMARTLNPDQKSVFAQLQKRTGMIFPETRLAEIKDTINKAAKAANLSVAEYCRHIAFDQALFDDLCDRVTIPETYFFRDPRQFEFVKMQVVPDWNSTLQKCGDGSRETRFRVLSAGCSTGEEIYSLAILMSEAGLTDNVQLFGTDISRRSLERAGKGDYGPWSLRISDQGFCSRHFSQKDGRYYLRPKYIDMVRLAHANLFEEGSLQTSTLGSANFDLIFCRNVLIYFSPDAVTRVLANLHKLLNPGGYLVLGPSDPAAHQFGEFLPVICDWGIFYRKAGGTAPAHPEANAPHAIPPQQEGKKSISGELQGKASKGSFEASRGAEQKKGATPHKHHYQAAKIAAAKAVPPAEMLVQAQSAYNQGQYEKAFNLTGKILDNPRAASVHVHALAHFTDSDAAEKVLKKLLMQHLSNFELQYLHGHLLMDLGRTDEAQEALKRCIFLDSKATMAHFSLALVQKKLKDWTGAKRSFRNVIDLCRDRPADEVLPYGDGERVRIIAAQAEAELRALAEK